MAEVEGVGGLHVGGFGDGIEVASSLYLRQGLFLAAHGHEENGIIGVRAGIVVVEIESLLELGFR